MTCDKAHALTQYMYVYLKYPPQWVVVPIIIGVDSTQTATIAVVKNIWILYNYYE